MDVTNQIIKFIQGIQVQNEGGRLVGAKWKDDHPSQDNCNQLLRQPSTLGPINVARRKAMENIVQAEKFKALINTPSDNNNNLQPMQPMQIQTPQFGQAAVVPASATNAEVNMNVGNNFSDLDIDNQFFYVTFHLEDGIKAKI